MSEKEETFNERLIRLFKIPDDWVYHESTSERIQREIIEEKEKLDNSIKTTDKQLKRLKI